MKITALVENVSHSELKPLPALSLYIETKKHKILFDLGNGSILFRNAAKRGIDLSKIDIVILSHGHMDHGGALKHFLKINHTAKIFVQRKAFEQHDTKVLFMYVNVGIDRKLAAHSQIVLVDGDYQIEEGMSLFRVKNTKKCYSDANDLLYAERNKDNFSHEQNLIIKEGNRTVLIVGCGHTGIVNIMEKAASDLPDVCIGGYHLYNPMTKKTVSEELLHNIAEELKKYHTKFYTCHCTGVKAFEYLSKHLNNMNYLSCGESIEV